MNQTSQPQVSNEEYTKLLRTAAKIREEHGPIAQEMFFSKIIDPAYPSAPQIDDAAMSSYFDKESLMEHLHARHSNTSDNSRAHTPAHHPVQIQDDPFDDEDTSWADHIFDN